MNARLKELHEKQQTVLAEARERLDQINTNTDESRAAELDASHDKAMAEFDRLQGLIEREQKLADIEGKFEERNQRARENRRPGASGEARGIDLPQGEEVTYRSAFAAMLAAGGDVSELSAEQRSVLRGGATAIEQRIQSTSSTAGGYTVPTELMNEIVKTMKDWGPLLDGNVVRLITTSGGNPINVPTIDDTAKGAGLHTEGTQATDDGSEDAVFGQKSLSAYLYDTEWVKVSYELLQDSMLQMEPFVGELLGERLARKGNAVATTGTGSSQPAGVAATATSGKTAVGTTAVTADELMDLEHSVNQAYRRSPKARWMFADSTFKALRKLKDGNGAYIFQSANLALGTPSNLLGYNFSINDDMPAMTTGLKPIAFGDFSRFWVRMIGAPVVGVVRERFFPDVGLLGLIRLDSRIVDAGAIKVLTMA